MIHAIHEEAYSHTRNSIAIPGGLLVLGTPARSKTSCAMLELSRIGASTT